MSLYANIDVSKTQGEPIVARETLSKRELKSAAAYAGVLATLPPSQEVAPRQDAPQPVVQQPVRGEQEPEKPTESSALQFKPTIRKIQKMAKPKTNIPLTTVDTLVAPAQATIGKSHLQDVSKIQEDIANDDVNGFYRTQEGQRAARREARKRKRKQNQGTYVWTWDDEYDPAHPNDYEAYIDSDEQIREQIEWKRKLCGKSEEPEGEGEYKGFAPPEEYEEWIPQEDEGEFVPEPAVEIELDESGDDAYMRRMRMAQAAGISIRPATPPPAGPERNEDMVEAVEAYETAATTTQKHASEKTIEPTSPPPPPPPQPFFTPSYPQPISLYADAPAMRSSAPTQSATISSEPVHYSSATISSEPVHYEPVNPPASTKDSSADEPRGSHPGQKDFASRLMSKYGWEKGQSLGASTQGITTPLVMKADKDRKGTGIILNKNKVVEDHGTFGKMTRCIVLSNVVGPGEVDEELPDEIGSECREKYGEVERVRVFEDRNYRNDEEAVRVFVLFTSELSALRAVNALDRRLFGGRTIKARFFDVEKLEAGDLR